MTMLSKTTQLEIQFGDCDPAGIVYYPNYFHFGSNATAGLLAGAIGMHKRDWVAHYGSAGIPMVDIGARFFKPSLYGDIVEIRSEITAIGRSSFSVGHTFFNAGELAVELREKRVWTVFDEKNIIRSAPLPDAIRKILGG